MYLVIQLVINATAFYIVAYLLPGVSISGWASLLVASIVWGIITLLVKPIIMLLTLPINIITLGLFTFVINAVLLMALGAIVPGFFVANFNSAFIASILLAITNMFLSSLID